MDHLSKTILTDNRFDEIIQFHKHFDCHKFSHLFHKYSIQFAQENNHAFSTFFSLLSSVTSYWIDKDSNDTPLKPYFINYEENQRTASIEDLNQDELNFLDSIVDELNNPELQSRIADVLWIRKRDHKRAFLAAKMYLKAYEQFSEEQAFHRNSHRIHRAAGLSLLFGKQNDFLVRMIQKLDGEIDQYHQKDESLPVHRLVELSLKLKTDYALKYANILKQQALVSEKKKNWGMARSCLDLAEECFKRMKQPEERNNVRRLKAETYVRQSDEALKMISNPNYLLAAIHLKSAIEVYRTMTANDEVTALHFKMIDYQKKGLAQMPIISHEIDITKHVLGSIKSIKNRPFLEQLYTLSMLTVANVRQLKRQTEENANRFLLELFFSESKINAEGKTIAVSPNDNSDKDQMIRNKMNRDARLHRQLMIDSSVNPMRLEIAENHFITQSDFMPIIIDNSFIPKGREEFFIKGFYYGLHGEFLICSHLLIPQLEHSIRYVLTKSGEMVTTLNKDGVQEEKNLNTLLYSEKLCELWGEDLVFDLQSLLVERHGENLRNNVSHGLFESDTFYSSQSVYLWWITLKLCMMSKFSLLPTHFLKD